MILWKEVLEGSKIMETLTCSWEHDRSNQINDSTKLMTRLIRHITNIVSLPYPAYSRDRNKTSLAAHLTCAQQPKITNFNWCFLLQLVSYHYQLDFPGIVPHKPSIKKNLQKVSTITLIYIYLYLYVYIYI